MPMILLSIIPPNKRISTPVSIHYNGSNSELSPEIQFFGPKIDR